MVASNVSAPAGGKGDVEGRPAIDVLIADGQRLSRECLRRILEEDNSGPDTLSKAEALHPQIVLLDLDMRGGGLSVARRLKSLDPAMRILVLTSYQDDEFVLRSLMLGVEGFLVKDRVVAELLSAVHRIHAVGRYFSSDLAERLALQPKELNHRHRKRREPHR